LTTPEEAQAFLAAMRDKSHQREVSHQPPSNVTADGMDAWFLAQKQRQEEMRQRRREAEQLLRGYRGGGGPDLISPGGGRARGRYSLPGNYGQTTTTTTTSQFTPSSAGASETLDDPDSFKQRSKRFDFLSAAERTDRVVEDEEKKTDSPGIKAAAVATQHASSTDSLCTPSEVSDVTVWRDFISSEPGARFPPEKDRYHLYLSYACPGSHRALIVRTLKGLKHAVSVTFVHPTWRLTNPTDPDDKHRGWVFGDATGDPFPNTIGRGGPFPPAYTGNEPDPIFDAYSMREIYEHAGDTSGKYTIPVLWDKKLNTIVNNESSDIAYMLNSCFNDFADDPDLDLYTEYDEEGVAKLNEVSEWLSPLMIHGVYRCGFAKNQRAYDKAIAELCEAFDRAEEILQQQRYLTGDTLTDADIRLFVSLIRFDEVYAIYFKANARLVMLTPAMLNFTREIYQMPGVAETCNMEQIKAHFFGSHAEWNKYSVIPRGLGFMELLDMPHDREEVGDGNEI
jgi:putative glutathione S-transferase